MRNPDIPRKTLFVREPRESRDPPGATQTLEAAVDYGDAGGVIAPIFQAPQSLQQDGHDITP
jgi:hypothetical protein